MNVISLFRHVSRRRVNSRKKLSNVDMRINCVA